MVSPRKSISALSLIPEERGKLLPVSTKSCESLYSNTSSSKSSINNLYRRKQNAGNVGGAGGNMGRHSTLIPATTEVRQRVLSARRLRMKTFQNQLADAQQTIADLAHENRILRTLHKRQDSALAKYESTNAELPKLLHSHAEELRVWQAKYRHLQQINKELEHKLKAKESIILTLSDQNKYYSQLNKDRNLEERQRLSEKLEKLETRLQEKDNDMKLLARRVQIETKNFKQQLLTEQKRTKDALMKLEKARLELSGYRKLDELGDKFSTLSVGRRTTNPTDDSKLEKDLERILADEVLDEDEKDLDADFDPGSQRSAKSPNNLTAESSLGYGNHKIASSLTVGKSRKQRQEGGGGLRPVTKQQQLARQQLLQGFERKTQKKDDPAHERLAAITDYEVEYENDHNGEFPGASDRRQSNRSSRKYANTGDGDEELDEENGDYEGEEEEVNGDSSRKADDDEVVPRGTFNAKYLVEGEEEQALEGLNDENGEDDDDERDVVCHTAKKTSHMKEEISSIRKQISHDYKEREAFLDTFCRQANSGVLLDETPKKRSNITLGQNLPSNRKNKLLAALKAIDDNNKSQD
ncbi:lebercilin-like [Rhagoletis pomonella]|uniref:lebercilin-like n=1 Tax=Rhagoletis pomonella TaxID=28610 RepID=UPI0017877B85|nr:lebercilin-like [Rhagoletis pomonella]